jgi:hypothetical protein
LPRAYIPLKTVPAAYPFPLKFENGVTLVSHEEFPPQHFKGWDEVFSRRELQDLSQWHQAIACDYGGDEGIQGKASPEARLANVRLALQLAAPIGTFLSVCIRERDDGETPSLITTRFEEFHGTPWSRMKGFTGMTAGQVQSIVNGLAHILEQGNPRTATPIRLFEHGLVSRDPYIRILLWVTAIDSVLMAVKADVFETRLCVFLGADTKVFPPEDGVYIQRPTVVKDVARDLFTLRSLLAHGRPIEQRFWEFREDLRELLGTQAYGSTPRYRVLLEEAALSVLTRVLHTIILDDLVNDFVSAKKWKKRLCGGGS